MGTWRLLRNIKKKVAITFPFLPSNVSFHAQSTRASCATRREGKECARTEAQDVWLPLTVHTEVSRGVGGEKSIRLIVGRFLRGQEVGQASLPRVYAANVRSICTVVRRDGRGSFDSTWKRADATIPRADPPWRESLRAARSLLWQWAFPPVSSNFRPAPANCLPNRDARFIRPITWKRYLPNRWRIIAMKFETQVLGLDRTTNFLFPPSSSRSLFSNWNGIELFFFFLIGLRFVRIKNLSRRERAESKTSSVENRIPFSLCD